ncbi:MAG TPA: methyltransferase dimerization domain-containing protein, partial [Candidatus Binatia bacterium]|nr:methyltransferase dimerization domain-containing protein [Candidatus Binatia bacterium]
MNFSQLMALGSGHAEARIVQTAVALGIFDALEAPQTAKSVATKLKLEPNATELLLNALAALRILEKRAKNFSLSDTAKQYLLQNSALYVGGMILFEELTWQSWTSLPEAIRTGRSVRRANMYQDDPKETEIFISAMDALVKARGDAEVLAKTLDWQRVGELLDIGSGPATYPITLCRIFPDMRATIFDLPGTLKL